MSSLSTKKLKKLVGEVLVGQATARSVGAALSFEQEVAVAERLMAWAKEHAGRSEHLSRVVEQRIVAMARDNYFNRSWAARFSCLYLHLLAGQAQRFDDRAKDGVALELERAMRTAPGSYAESMWTRCFHEQYGRHEWDGLIEIGNLGYRLEEPAEQGGHQVTFRLVSAAPDPALPKRLAIVLVYGHELVAREKTRRDVQALAKESPSRPILVAVFEGKADYRLLDHQTVMSRYGAECVKLEGLTGEGLKAALREARDRLGSIPNPLQKFPKVGKDLTQDDLVPRLLVVPALEDALSSQYAPVVVYCMRKSGKTSTAKLLRLVTNERVVDLSQSLEGFDKDPYQLLKHLRNIEPLEAHRTGVLVLDEFDYFARQLKNQPEAVAMTYLNWLREAARHSRILCLGLDPFPFRTLYPASNPFQELTEFHLPYFSERECAILTQKMAGQLRLEDRLVEWLWKQSGGHPGVLRGLLEWYLEVRFGKNVQRIPTKDPLLLRDVPIERLEADFGNAERASILKTILDTMRSDTEGTLREAWKVMQQVIVHEPDGISRSALEKQLAVVDLWPAGHASEHPSIGLSLLFSWGLIRQSLDGSIHTTIPLLRRQLRSMQRLPNEG